MAHVAFVGHRPRLGGQGFGVTELAPHLLADVRGNRREHQDQRLHGGTRHSLQTGQVVVEHDELGDGGVRAHAFHFRGHFGNRVVEQLQGLFVRRVLGHMGLAGGLIDHIAPQTLQEAHATDHVAGVPRARLVQRAHAHFVQAEGVGTVVLVHVVRGHDVLEGLAHLAELAVGMFAVPGEGRLAGGVGRAFHDLVGRHVLAAVVGVGVGLDHALVEQLVERFGRVHVAEVEEHLVPEAGVEQVEHSVFDAADVQVHTAFITRVLVVVRAHPVVELVLLHHVLGVGRVDVTHVVPAGAGPVRHGVGVAVVGLLAVAQVELDLDPVLVAAQRCLRVGLGVHRIEGARLIVGHVGQVDRQCGIRQQVRGAVFAVDDREGLAPVALAGEQPVAQTVAYGALAHAGGFEPGVDLGDGVVHAQAVKAQRVALGFGGLDGGVDHDAVMGDERRLALVVGQVVAGIRQRRDGVDDRQTELHGKVVIALVATRHGHNGTGAVVHQHVVGSKQRELRAGDRVGGVQAGEQTGLLTGLVHAVLGGLGFGGQTVGLHRLDRVGIAALPVFGYIGRPFGGHVLQQVMFRGNHGERGAEQRVGTGGVDFHVLVTVGSGHDEVHGGTMGFTDPVALHELDLLRPVDAVKIGDEAVAVLGDAHGPLA